MKATGKKLVGLVMAGVVLVVLVVLGMWLATRDAGGPLRGEFNHDFGDVARHPNEMVSLRHVFMLTNVSPEPVRVLMARPDCSCVSAREGLPATVMPGKSLELPVVMRLEAIKKNVTIYLELADDTQQKLTVSATSKFFPRVWFWEPRIAIAPGAPIDHPFSIDYYGSDVPPLPEIEVPDGFKCHFTAIGWRPVQASEWLGVRPSIWRGELHIEPPAQPWPDGATLRISVAGSKPVEAPLVVAQGDSTTTQPAAIQPGNPRATAPAGR